MVRFRVAVIGLPEKGHRLSMQPKKPTKDPLKKQLPAKGLSPAAETKFNLSKRLLEKLDEHGENAKQR